MSYGKWKMIVIASATVEASKYTRVGLVSLPSASYNASFDVLYMKKKVKALFGWPIEMNYVNKQFHHLKLDG